MATQTTGSICKGQKNDAIHLMVSNWEDVHSYQEEVKASVLQGIDSDDHEAVKAAIQQSKPLARLATVAPGFKFVHGKGHQIDTQTGSVSLKAVADSLNTSGEEGDKKPKEEDVAHLFIMTATKSQFVPLPEKQSQHGGSTTNDFKGTNLKH